MKILILHSTYRSGPASGENRVVEDEARLLSEAGHEVDIFAPGPGQPSGLKMIQTGLGAIWSKQAVGRSGAPDRPSEPRHRALPQPLPVLIAGRAQGDGR